MRATSIGSIESDNREAYHQIDVILSKSSKISINAPAVEIAKAEHHANRPSLSKSEDS